MVREHTVTVRRSNTLLQQHAVGLFLIDVDVHRQHVVEEAEVHTDVPLDTLLPLQGSQLDAVGREARDTQVGRTLRISVQVEVVAVGGVTVEGPAAADAQHVHAGLLLHFLHEGLVDDVPTTGDGGEVTPAAVLTEAGRTVDTESEVHHVAALPGVVRGERPEDAAPLAVGARQTGQQSARRGVGYAGCQTVGVGGLRAAVTGVELETAQSGQIVVFILEVRREGEGVLRVEREALGTGAESRVRVQEVGRGELAGQVFVSIVVADVHVGLAFVVQLMLVGVGTEQLILQDQFGRDLVVAGHIVGQMLLGNDVVHATLVLKLLTHGRRVVVAGDGDALTCLDGIVVVVGGHAVHVFTIDGHVGHLPLSCTDDTAVDVGLLGVGHVEVTGQRDTVVDVVVEGHTGGETLQTLLDDGTAFVLETAGKTEGGLLVTAAHSDVVLLAETDLLDGVKPVGVVVEHVALGELGVVGIVDFLDVGSLVNLVRIEVGLFQHHGVLVAVEQLEAGGLTGDNAGERVAHLSGTAATALRGDLNDTVTALATPNGSGGTVLEHLDVLNILSVHLQ